VLRAFAVVNPAAGAGDTGRRWPALAERLARSNVILDVALTAGHGDATGLARSAVEAGHSLVVAVGGDGTVNEVINGITSADGRPLATLGVIATGRGRDVCRNLAIPREPDAAVAVLAAGSDHMADLGVVGVGGSSRLFVGAVGIGFDADVARRAHGRRGHGTIPYLLGVLAALARHRPSAVDLAGDFRWAGAATAVIVANGASYGGGMKIAPAADTADGRLDLVILGDLGRAELLWRLPSVYRGTHVRHPKVLTGTVRALTVSACPGLPVHVDGEPIGTTPAAIALKAAALRVRRL
jgi:YegS/Rv2252/BmrU family lipid kinase